jgi:short-subunit dehydrogenase
MMQQTILIIGGTSGLGRRLAELYCSEGYKVGVVGRRKELLDTLHANFPKNIASFQYDISREDCADQVTSFIESLGGIDKLILSASVVNFNPSLDWEKEKTTVDINVKGYAAVLNSAYQYFSSKNHGHIIGITSIAAARGNKTAIAYNASKAFQASYLEGLRLKAKSERKNIAITELVPGYMDTGMAKGDRLFWVASLDKAALQAKKNIEEKKERAFITGRWRWIYMIYKYLPSFFYSYLINSKLKLEKRN